MKKTKTKQKKLLLSKEKVRELNPTNLGDAVGGEETSHSSSTSGSVRTSSWSKILG